MKKSEKSRKLKCCSLFGINVFFNILTLMRINYQCSKLKTHLVTIFLSEWVYYVYIEILLRLSPTPTFRALKICYIFLGTFVDLERFDPLILKILNCNINTLISKSNNIINSTGIPFLCVSLMWPNIMNINDCNTWQQSATLYGNLFMLALIGKVVIWSWWYHLFCSWNTINLIRDMAIVRFVNAVL